MALAQVKYENISPVKEIKMATTAAEILIDTLTKWVRGKFGGTVPASSAPAAAPAPAPAAAPAPAPAGDAPKS